MSDLIEIKKQASEAVSALREMKEKHGEQSVEFKAAIDKTEKTLAEFDKKNGELMVKINEQKNAQEHQVKRIEEMELAIARGIACDGKAAFRQSAEFKAVDKYLRSGNEVEIKAHKVSAFSTLMSTR